MDLPIVAVMVTFVLVAVAFVSLVAAAVAWHASRRAGLELDDVRRGIGGGAHSAQRNVRELRASLDGARLQADRLEGALDTIELGLLVLDPAARLVHRPN